MNNTITSVREATYLSLWKCRASGSYSNIEIDSTLKRHKFDDKDRALFTNLVYGTIERKLTLDYIISKFSKLSVKEIDPRVLIIIELGLYQCFFLDRIPDYAAVSECVELSRKYAKTGSSSFVNAVLREALRERENIVYPAPDSDFPFYLSIKYSFPMWLCKMWCDMYGQACAEALLERASHTPPVTLRVNTLTTTRNNLTLKLEAAGIKSIFTKFSPHGLILSESVPYSTLDETAPGEFFVQDEASQLAVKALGARESEFIIDVCCAPGGKAFGCALEMNNHGRLLACDLHSNKLSLVERGASRLGISIIETAALNATERRDELVGKADRVICDAPCSGLGVIAKKPEIRYKAPDDIARLPEIQRAIIDNVSSYVKPGGILLYSTCTLNRKENDEIIFWFLSKHPEFSPVSTGTGKEQDNGIRTLILHIDDSSTDGFFFAKLKKSE